MEIVLVKPDAITASLKIWGIPAIGLPAHTFGAYEGGELVAIAGLRLAEGPLCNLDSMATNPNASAELRHEAIVKLTDVIFEKAKSLGYRSILAHSKEPSIIARALALGFLPVPEISLVRSL